MTLPTYYSFFNGLVRAEAYWTEHALEVYVYGTSKLPLPDNLEEVYVNLEHERHTKNQQREIGLFVLTVLPDYNWDYYLEYFYNHLSSSNVPVPGAIKGFMGQVFCTILRDQVARGRIDEDGTLALEASGKLPNKEDMRGLLIYYKQLGFTLMPGESESSPHVYMYGKIRDILLHCTASKRTHFIQFDTFVPRGKCTLDTFNFLADEVCRKCEEYPLDMLDNMADTLAIAREGVGRQELCELIGDKIAQIQTQREMD